jgi:hypothetical protein
MVDLDIWIYYKLYNKVFGKNFLAQIEPQQNNVYKEQLFNS